MSETNFKVRIGKKKQTGQKGKEEKKKKRNLGCATEHKQGSKNLYDIKWCGPPSSDNE